MSEMSPVAELQALIDADFVGLPREALVASIHDLAEQLLNARPHLERLAELGHESWKTPGHPMNNWVSRDTVNLEAERALGVAH